jgi:hypothetical protein
MSDYSSNSFLPSIARYTGANEGELEGLVNTCTPAQLHLVASALDAAYKKGQDDADARTAKLMTRVFSAFIGVTPGIDQLAADGTPEASRVRKMISLMRGRG